MRPGWRETFRKTQRDAAGHANRRRRARRVSWPVRLLDFAEAQSIGYRDGAVYIQDQDQVEVYNPVAERLSTRALSEADSVDTIRDRIAALT